MYYEKLLKSEEKAVFNFRHLYKSYGYQPFKMSKFEEYDLYVRNKDFLIGDSVITFTDTDGKLLALKPDVTLSIIKNSSDEPNKKQKVYYNESVYRISGSTHQFKEIMQTGLECIGDIDEHDIFEALYLALRSLEIISSDFILDISHMGLYSALMDSVSTDKKFRREMTKLVAEKNSHEAIALCEKYGLGIAETETVKSMFSLYGDLKTVLPKLWELVSTNEQKEALTSLAAISDMLAHTEFENKIKFDFSVINDMRYYDGIVFKGFINGIFEDVLTGGQYGSLVRRMGHRFSGVGFAVCVDLISELDNSRSKFDVDVLLIYSNKTKAETVILTKEQLVSLGKSVYSATQIPDGLRYREIVNLCEDA